MVELGPKFEGDRVVIYLDPGQPIELGNLSESFAALARMYERHYRKDGDNAPKLYVTRLETGSVVMEIAPYLPLFGQVVVAADTTIILADFTNRLWRGIKAFSGAPSDVPRIEPPPIDDARDIKEFVKPLLGKKGAELGITHARYEKTDGERSTVVEYKFQEDELNRAAINIGEALENPSMLGNEGIIDALPSAGEHIMREAMLFMDQANRHPGKEKGRTGDRGVIPSISDKALPVYFRKSFQDLKGHMIRDVNPLTSTFVVDVHVQNVNGEPKGYVITDVHQAIPPDDAE